MRMSLAVGLMLTAALAAAPAPAATVSDAVGDFVPGFIGPFNGDLDVTSFSVDYNPATSMFILGATFADVINPATPGFYVIGANTGTGPAAPFASVGQPNVRFNQVIVINKNGTGNVGQQQQLAAGSIAIVGNIFTAFVPLAFLPSTGFAPTSYGFNLWPRVGQGNNNQISDFSPENSTLAVAPVPEPASWAMMIAGFGATGAAMRRRRGRATPGIA